MHKRRLFALIGACLMLFAQFAMAVHACMGMTPAEALAGVAAVESEAPPCHESGGVESNACLAHCQAGLQSASPDSQPVSPAALLPVVAYLIDRQVLLPVLPLAHGYGQPLLTRVTAPPARVRFCCLRT